MTLGVDFTFCYLLCVQNLILLGCENRLWRGALQVDECFFVIFELVNNDFMTQCVSEIKNIEFIV